MSQRISRRHLILTLILSGALALSGCKLSPSHQAKVSGTSRVATSTLGQDVVIRSYRMNFEDASALIPATQAGPQTQAAFPEGFPRAMGSGMVQKASSNGVSSFWVVSDRGPNADGPAVHQVDSKLFPIPDYAPSIGVLTLHGDEAILSDLHDLKIKEHALSGRPHPEGSLGATHEVPLDDQLHRLPSDPIGIDPEAISYDGRNLWIAEEYGPSLFRVNQETGDIIEQLHPGHGLPEIMAHRRINRGFESLSFDTDRKTLNALLQSNIDEAAPFIRWLELDPSTGNSRQYAYPITPDDYKHQNPGEAKIGDMASLGRGQFVVIEEGKDSDGHLRHWLMLIDLQGATDINGMEGLEALSHDPSKRQEFESIHSLQKIRLLDLDQAGWTLEKAEGLAVINEKTLALTNDNDFGLDSTLVNRHDKAIKGKVHACALMEDGSSAFPSLKGKKCPEQATGVRLVPGNPSANEQIIWTLTFEKPLRDHFNTPHAAHP